MRESKITAIMFFLTLLMMILAGCLTEQSSSGSNSSITGYLSTDIASLVSENSNELSANSNTETIIEGKELTSFIDSYTEVRKKLLQPWKKRLTPPAVGLVPRRCSLVHS